MSLVNQVISGQYRVDAFIASGGMATVYRVWDMKRNVPLAMKVLHADMADDPSVLKSFKREANALRKLSHPHIVPFYGLYETSQFLFLLEGFIDGPTLKQILRERKGKPASIEETLAYVKALSASLGYAHVNGVVHCDIKPGNLMLDQGGKIYLADFGIARHAESTTTTIGGAGTPAYMSPEQIKGESVTPATDVYALGILVYEMLTGVRPFRGTGVSTKSQGSTVGERVRIEQLTEVPTDPHLINSALPPAISTVLQKALEKDPQKRYQKTKDFFEDLCNAAGISTGEVPDRVDVPRIEGEQFTSTEEAQEVVSSSEPSWPALISADESTKKIDWKVWAPAILLILVSVFAIIFFVSNRGTPDSPINQFSQGDPKEENAVALAAAITDTPTASPTRRATNTPTKTLAPARTPSPTPTDIPQFDLAFASNKDGKFGVYLMNSRNPINFTLLNRPAEYANTWWPSFCKDFVAAEVYDQNQPFPQWIYLLDYEEDNAAVRFDPPGSDPQNIGVPVCAPGTNTIAFSNNKNDQWIIMVADGSGEKKIFETSDSRYWIMGYASWLRDLSGFYWMGVVAGNRSFVIHKTTDLSSKTGITESIIQGKYPAISPDGSKLAYIHPSDMSLRIMDVQTKKEIFKQALSYKKINGDAMPATAVWSADGEWLYFSSAKAGNWDIYRIHPDGKGMENMTEGWASDELMPATR